MWSQQFSAFGRFAISFLFSSKMGAIGNKKKRFSIDDLATDRQTDLDLDLDLDLILISLISMQKLTITSYRDMQARQC